MKTTCTTCGKEITFYYMCDYVEGDWCEDCFSLQPCLKHHGEGCSTAVFENAEEVKGDEHGG